MAANTCKATLCSPRCAGGDWPGKHAASTAGLFFPQRDHEYFTLLPALPAGERYRGHCTQQRSHSQLTTSHSRMTENGKSTGKKKKKKNTNTKCQEELPSGAKAPSALPAWEILHLPTTLTPLLPSLGENPSLIPSSDLEVSQSPRGHFFF